MMKTIYGTWERRSAGGWLKMNQIPVFLRTLGAAAIGLGLLVVGGVFAASVFVAVVLVIAFGVLAALLTGRKPEAFELWSRWRAMRDGSRFGAVFNRSGAPAAVRPKGARAPTTDVVDVESRDLPK